MNDIIKLDLGFKTLLQQNRGGCSLKISMINLGQIKKTRFLIMVVIIFTMLWVFAVGNVLSNFKTEQQNLLNEERKDIQSRIDSTLATYDSFTNYIFDDLLLHSEVTELLYQASFSDESQKLDYRESLHEMLISEYDLLEEHNFRQFHFHLPDGESFLRFHSPSDYGDHLFDVRETVRLANTELKKVVGFEEGRIFSGYRFVFPLFHYEKHVGSVEISVDLNTILNLLEKRNPEISAIYILEKEVVLGKVFDVHLDNYVPAFNLDDFFMDKSQIEKMHLDSDRYAQINNPMVLNYINEALSSEGELNQSLLIKTNSSSQGVHVFPIYNIFDNEVGYFIALKEVQIDQWPIRELILITLVYILLLTIAIFFTRDKIRLNELANKDQLTDIYNRHKLIELSEREFRRSKRNGRVFSALILDVDHFKNINDTYGHAEGDLILKEIGKLFKNTLRAVDIYGRWGGEEFLIITPETSAKNALIIAERLRMAINSIETPLTKSTTVSIGIAEFKLDEQSIDEVIHRADEALYCAKETGRNKVVIWPSKE